MMYQCTNCVFRNKYFRGFLHNYHETVDYCVAQHKPISQITSCDEIKAKPKVDIKENTKETK